MTRTLEQINIELTKLITDNQKEIEKLEKELASIDPTIEKAKQDVIKAKKVVNAEAYDIAKRELWTAENTKEMLTDKLKELRHDPIVTKERYRELYFEICSVGDNKIDEAFEKISQIFPELEQIIEEHKDITEDITQNLRLLESLGRNSEEFKKGENGHIDSAFYNGLSYRVKKNTTNFLEEFIKRVKEVNNG
ncbi:hypothetical protein [Streptococcus suis]|uniref:hypothetical protein n=1 Tax=Streptococcus suis TaxID=1307 RepID=UPI000CF3CAB0|nr:hypothetical protein [Streptococcus suis]